MAIWTNLAIIDRFGTLCLWDENLKREDYGHTGGVGYFGGASARALAHYRDNGVLPEGYRWAKAPPFDIDYAGLDAVIERAKAFADKGRRPHGD